MSPVHEFILVSKDKADFSFRDYVWDKNGFNAQKSSVSDYVEVNDDFIEYIMDSLEWIPTYNPSKREKGYGLNYYGVTLIREDGALLAMNIFKSWADLFSNGPDILELRGAFTWQTEDQESGHYETIKVARNEIVDVFKKLTSFAEQVMNGELYLLHLGI